MSSTLILPNPVVYFHIEANTILVRYFEIVKSQTFNAILYKPLVKN